MNTIVEVVSEPSAYADPEARTLIIIALTLGIVALVLLLVDRVRARGVKASDRSAHLIPWVTGIALVAIIVFTMGLFIGGNTQEEAKLTLHVAAEQAVATDNGIPAITAVGEPIDACLAGSDDDVAEYAWTDVDGEPAKGSIIKTAENDGSCTYTLLIFEPVDASLFPNPTT